MRLLIAGLLVRVQSEELPSQVSGLFGTWAVAPRPDHAVDEDGQAGCPVEPGRVVDARRTTAQENDGLYVRGLPGAAHPAPGFKQGLAELLEAGVISR